VDLDIAKHLEAGECWLHIGPCFLSCSAVEPHQDLHHLVEVWGPPDVLRVVARLAQGDEASEDLSQAVAALLEAPNLVAVGMLDLPIGAVGLTTADLSQLPGASRDAEADPIPLRFPSDFADVGPEDLGREHVYTYAHVTGRRIGYERRDEQVVPVGGRHRVTSHHGQQR
jgi:hypothetical protein